MASVEPSPARHNHNNTSTHSRLPSADAKSRKHHLTTPAPFNIKDMRSPRPQTSCKYIGPHDHLPAFGPGKDTLRGEGGGEGRKGGKQEEGDYNNQNNTAKHSSGSDMNWFRHVSASPWGHEEHKGKYQVRIPVEQSPGPAAYSVPRFPVTANSEILAPLSKKPLTAASAATKGMKSNTTTTTQPIGTHLAFNPSSTFRGYRPGVPMDIDGNYQRSSFGGAPRFKTSKPWTPGPGTYTNNGMYKIRGGASLKGSSPRTVIQGVIDEKADVFLGFPHSSIEAGRTVGPGTYDTKGVNSIGDAQKSFYTHNVQLRKQAEKRAAIMSSQSHTA